MKVWALKKISKKSIWAGFADGSSRGQEKAASLRFFCTSSLLFLKGACLLEIKRAAIRILESEPHICAIEEDILMKI